MYVALGDTPHELVDPGGQKWYRFLAEGGAPAFELQQSEHGFLYTQVVSDSKLVGLPARLHPYLRPRADDIWVPHNEDNLYLYKLPFRGWQRSWLDQYRDDALKIINEATLGNRVAHRRLIEWRISAVRRIHPRPVPDPIPANSPAVDFFIHPPSLSTTEASPSLPGGGEPSNTTVVTAGRQLGARGGSTRVSRGGTPSRTTVTTYSPQPLVTGEPGPRVRALHFLAEERGPGVGALRWDDSLQVDSESSSLETVRERRPGEVWRPWE